MSPQHHEEGAQDQVEALYRDHGHRVLAYLARRTSCAEDAADVMGEVMVTTWRRRGDLPPSPGDVPWLFATARNTLANHHRSTARRGQTTEALAATVRHAVGEHTDASDLAIDVARALEDLAPLDREILTLDAWEELTSPQIAVVLQMNPATVRSRLHRARRRLSATLHPGRAVGPTPGPPRLTSAHR